MKSLKPILLLLMVIFSSCEEKINVNLKSQDQNLLVVEGVLTNENIRHLVRLTHTHTDINGDAQPATGAVITVTNNSKTDTLTEIPVGSGLYYTDSMIAVVGSAYHLTIHDQGKVFTADDEAVAVEPMAPLQYVQVNDTALVTLSLNPSGSDANYIQHQITWKNTPLCNGIDSCSAEVVYYDLKTIDVNEIYKPSKAAFDFPVGSTVIRRKFSASPGYKEFLRAVLSETEWRGGIFDVERANAPTNLSEGGIGFFGVSMVISDTTLVK